MGISTLENFRDDVASAMQRSVQQCTSQRIDGWVNRALQEFGYALKFRELEGIQALPTVVGTASYAPAADWRMWHELGIQMFNAAGDNLGKILPETREIYLQHIDTLDVSQRTQPGWYHQYGALLFLRPIPDAIYSLQAHYWKKLTPLAAKGDVSPFRDEWDEAVMLGALYRGFRHFGEFEKWQITRNEYLAYVRSRASEEDIEEFPVGSIDPYPKSAEEMRTGIPRG